MTFRTDGHTIRNMIVYDIEPRSDGDYAWRVECSCEEVSFDEGPVRGLMNAWWLAHDKALEHITVHDQIRSAEKVP